MRIGILSAELGHEDVHENKRLAREIRLKGHRPLVINYRKTVLAIAKNRRILYQPDKKEILRQVRVDAVIPRINEADEQSINLATLALDCLISGGAYSTASPEAIRLSKNKINSLMALSAAGIGVPRSVAITGTEIHEVDIETVLNAVEPAISKRLIVKTNIGTHGLGVMSANTRADARAIMDGFLANNIAVMLQQFVEPSKKNIYTDLRLVVVNGVVVGSMQRVSTRKNEIRANIALGGKGLPYTPTEAEVDLAKRAAKAVGLPVAGIDIIPSGRQRLVIEVNCSPGFAIEEYTKVNIAKKIVALAVSNAQKSNRFTPQKIATILKTDIPMPKPGIRVKKPNLSKVTRR